MKFSWNDMVWNLTGNINFGEIAIEDVCEQR